MEKQHSQIFKTIGYGLVIFSCLGLTLAGEALEAVGLQGNMTFLLSLSFIFAVLLAGRSVVMVAVLALGVLLVNLPDTTLLQYDLDRDLLLALVCAAIFVPTAYNLLSD